MNLRDGYLLTRQTILWFHDLYRASDEDRRDFRYAPLICRDLSRLPPALVIVAEFDPLKDEGLAYARRLREAGNEVEAVDLPGHGAWLHLDGRRGGCGETRPIVRRSGVETPFRGGRRSSIAVIPGRLTAAGYEPAFPRWSATVQKNA